MLDSCLFLARSQTKKVNPPTHILWETIREYSELQRKNSSAALKPNAFTKGRGKKNSLSQIDENQSKYGLVVAHTAILAGPKTQKASSAMAPNAD